MSSFLDEIVRSPPATPTDAKIMDAAPLDAAPLDAVDLEAKFDRHARRFHVEARARRIMARLTDDYSTSVLVKSNVMRWSRRQKKCRSMIRL